MWRDRARRIFCAANDEVDADGHFFSSKLVLLHEISVLPLTNIGSPISRLRFFVQAEANLDEADAVDKSCKPSEVLRLIEQPLHELWIVRP
jgi:hypothetical protein